MQGITINLTRVDGQSESKTLAPGRYVIGRETGDLMLGDPNASESHAELVVEAGQATITDLGSTNGTFLATGDRLDGAHRLLPNMPVRLGKTLLSIAPAGRGGTVMMSDVAPPASQSSVPPVAGSTSATGIKTRSLGQAKEVARDIHGANVTLRAVPGTVLHSATNYTTSTSGGGGSVGPDIFGDTRGRINPITSTTTPCTSMVWTGTNTTWRRRTRTSPCATAIAWCSSWPTARRIGTSGSSTWP